MNEKQNILVVDDTPSDLELMVKTLAASGYEAQSATSGEQALSLAAASRPDLILLDVRMNGMDGLEVLRQLKAGEATRGIPVILISAFADTADWVAGLKMGAGDYVGKPFRREELLTRVRTHLALRQAQQSLEQQTVELRENLQLAERSRLALLSVMEDQKRAHERARAMNEKREQDRQTMLQMEAERIRLALAIEQAAEMVLITDTQGSIQYVNPAFTKCTGYSREEALGHNPRFLGSGKQAPAFYREMWAALTRGEVWHGRFVNRRKNGSLYEEDATISPVRDTAGQVVSYIALKLDVTHEAELEAQLRQSQKVDAIGRLAGGVAHDFNNLLNVILGYGEMLLRRPDLPESIRPQIVAIHRAGERAADVTRQLLAFSRKQISAPQVFDLNEAIPDMVKMIRRLIGENIDLHLKASTPSCHVMADFGQLQQVVTNLCLNARDAMPDGGKITIETKQLVRDGPWLGNAPMLSPGNYVVLAISDTGVGMTDEVKAHLFEPFFTTKELGKGTGLGLAVCHGIVKQSKGEIAVYSEEGVGTTVKIYLPCADPAAASVAPESEATALNEYRGRGETILLVEDEPSVRELIAHVLTGLGYRVLSDPNGQAALARLQQAPGQRIDLLLTDVVMPGISGRETATRLKEFIPCLKTIFISGYTDDAIVHHGILDPGVNFIPKPFASVLLARRVRELLDA